MNQPNHATNSDPELLEAYERTGCEQAFAELVRRHLNLVYGIALRKTRRSDWAHDITQEVFITLARKARPGLKLRSTLNNWLYQTALYQTAHRFRSEQRYWDRNARYYREEQLRLEQDVSDLDTGQLDEALQTLHRDERSIVLAHYYEGKTYREIGNDLGKTSEACRKMCSRAVKRLGEWLKAHGQAPAHTSVAVAMAGLTSQQAPAQLAPRICERALAAANAGTLGGWWMLWGLPGIAMMLGVIAPLLVAWPRLAERRTLAAGPAADSLLITPPPSLLTGERNRTQGSERHVDLLALARRLGPRHASEYPQTLPPQALARSLNNAQIARLAQITLEEHSLAGAADFVFRLWGERDPLAGLNYLDYRALTEKHSLQAINMGQVNFQRFVVPLRNLFQGWALSDPAGLATWAEQQGRTADLCFAGDALASCHPAYALTLVLDEEASQDPYLKPLHKRAQFTWARLDPEAFQQYLREQGVPEASLQTELLRWRGPNTHSTSGAADALESLAFAKELPDPGERRQFLEQALRHLGFLHPLLALQEYEALPSSMADESMLAAILGCYRDADPLEAESWAKDHLDEALETFLEKHKPERPSR